LVLTGTMAYDLVKDYIKPFADSVEVIKLPISIAAFISPQFVIQHLKKLDLSSYDSIILPGLMQGSTYPIEDAFHIPTFKGPRYASDLPIIFEESLQLSKTIPADKLLVDKGLKEYDDLVQKVYQEGTSHPFIELPPFRIGIGYPPLILAEIVDAPKLDLSRILVVAQYFLDKGANMLDIGAVVGQNNAKKIQKIVEELKSHFNVPISIDSMLPDEIEVAVEAGADLILSLDAGNMKQLKNLPKDRVITIIPTNTKEGIFPKSPLERIELLNTNIRNAKRFGFSRILVDPLLESPISPGFTRSLETFIQFRKTDPHTPFLFGAGNVSELIDADSIGINGLLACIAVELGVAVILTTEYSNKTRNTIHELAEGLKLAYLANYKKRPPVGLPFHLLLAKNKKKYDLPDLPSPPESFFVAESEESYTPDPQGYFKIWINHESQLISVLYFKDNKPLTLVQSSSAEALGKKILSLNYIQEPTHILYLGRELERAEIALFLGKDYIQDLKFSEVF